MSFSIARMWITLQVQYVYSVNFLGISGAATYVSVLRVILKSIVIQHIVNKFAVVVLDVVCHLCSTNRPIFSDTSAVPSFFKQQPSSR